MTNQTDWEERSPLEVFLKKNMYRKRPTTKANAGREYIDVEIKELLKLLEAELDRVRKEEGERVLKEILSHRIESPPSAPIKLDGFLPRLLIERMLSKLTKEEE